MPNTREKLIDLLPKADTYGCEQCAKYDDCDICPANAPNGCRYRFRADHLIANGVTVQQWIPVTERLPEDDLPKDSNVKQIKVLVAYKTNGRWVERTQLRVKGYWYREPDKWDWLKTSDPISHWMPLPEPPKGE